MSSDNVTANVDLAPDRVTTRRYDLRNQWWRAGIRSRFSASA